MTEVFSHVSSKNAMEIKYLQLFLKTKTCQFLCLPKYVISEFGTIFLEQWY